ncbi:hypothetical protein Q9L58_005493 [Maublancomyces gigas]|uniref:Uncharacterized protein n=1 Tax=Discina gigas TaxID=1032678 RepID=A0ABR3GIJ2_9PEZI
MPKVVWTSENDRKLLIRLIERSAKSYDTVELCKMFPGATPKAIEERIAKLKREAKAMDHPKPRNHPKGKSGPKKRVATDASLTPIKTADKKIKVTADMAIDPTADSTSVPNTPSIRPAEMGEEPSSRGSPSVKYELGSELEPEFDTNIDTDTEPSVEPSTDPETGLEFEPESQIGGQRGQTPENFLIKPESEEV